MIVGPLRLEARDCPAVWYGGELWLSGRAVVPFAGWHGGLNTLAAGGLVYVAPGSGGGPRVAVFDRATGERTKPDYFAGDPDSRAGVAFVPTDPPPAGLVPLPAVEYGDPAAWTVFVDFEEPRSPGFVRDAMAGLHRLKPQLHLTTTRPAEPPDRYGTAVFGADLSYFNTPVGGIAMADWTDGQPPNTSEAVYVDGRYVLDAAGAAKILDHEISHALKLISDEV